MLFKAVIDYIYIGHYLTFIHVAKRAMTSRLYLFDDHLED